MNEIKFRLTVDPAALQQQLMQVERQFMASSGNMARALDSAGGAGERMGNSIARGNDRAADSAERLSRAVAKVGHYSAALGGGMVAAGAVRMLASMADEVNSLDGRLRTVTTTTAEFSRAQADIAGIAERQRKGLGDIAGLYTSIKGASSELGASQSEVAKVTEAVGAALTLSGTSAQEAAGPLLQFGQALGGGKVRAEEFNSMLEGMRPLIVAAAKNIDAAGGSVARLKQLSNDGKLSSQEFFAAIIKGSDDLIAASSKMPVTIEQSFTVLRNESLQLIRQLDSTTGASATASGAVLALAKNLDVLVLAGSAAAAVMGTRMVGAVASMVAANLAARATGAAQAQAALQQATAATAQAAAQVAAARAMNLGLGSQAALTIATERHTAALAVQASAQARAAAATTASGAAASLAGGALGLLGGPIGLVVTLLTVGATAWALWGSSAKKASQEAKEDVMASADAMIKKLKDETEMLERRNALRNAGVPVARQGSDEQMKMLGALANEINNVNNRIAEAKARHADTFFMQRELEEKLAKIGELTTAMRAAQAAKEQMEGNTRADKRDEWMAKMGDHAVQLRLELKKAKEEFQGVIPKDVEQQIRAHFVSPAAKALAELAAQGKKLREDLMEQGSGYSPDYAEKIKQLDAAAKKYKWTLEEHAAANRMLLDQQPFMKAAAEAQKKAHADAAQEADRAAQAIITQAQQSARSAVERMQSLQIEVQATAMSQAQNITLAEAIERVTIARLGERAEAAERAGNDPLLSQLESEIAARTKIADMIHKGAGKEQAKNGEAINQFLNKDFGADLAAGFDKASQSLGAFVKGFGSLVDMYGEANEASKENARKNKDNAKEFEKVQAQINSKVERATINSFGNMAGAAKGFFKEGSKGYKALENAEKVFRAFELAMSAKAIAQKLFETMTVTSAKVSGEAAVTAAVVAGAPAQIAANQAVGMSNAAAAVAGQGKGDPYTAFPRIAAMAAIMAAIGFAVGLGGGGKSKADPGNTGTGTVFGDSSAQSKSINNSIELLAKNSDIGLVYSQGMLAALRNIESAMGGVTNLVLRSNAQNGDAAEQFGIPVGSKPPPIAATMHMLAGAAIAGPVGAAIGYAISKIGFVKKIDTAIWGGKTSITGNGLFAGPQSMGSVMSGGLNLQTYADVKKSGGWFHSDKNSTQFQAADATLSQQFGLVFKNFASAITLASGPLGAALGDVQGRIDAFVINIGKINLKDLTGEQIQEKLAAVLGAEADRLAQAVLPGLQDFQKVGEGYFETVVRVANGVEVAKAALDRLGISAVSYAELTNKQGDVGAEVIRESLRRFEQTAHGLGSGVDDIIKSFDGSAQELIEVYTSLMTLRDGLAAVGANVRDLSAAMIRGAGGADALQGGLDDYFENYLSEGEQIAEMTRRMTAQFAAAGVAMPASIEDFKKLVQGIDTSTEAGQLLFGKVITLSGGFAQLQQSIDQTAVSASDMAAKQRDLKARIWELENEGNAAAIRARELAGMDAATQALQQRVWALEDEAAASAAAAQAAQVVANQRANLEQQLLQLQGNTAAIRARELAALDPSNRAIQERIWALQDEAAAAQAATVVANQRKGLEDRLLQIQGDTAAIRARELAAIDPSNQALQLRIWALEDAQKKEAELARIAEEQANAAQQAQEEAARAADQLREAWQGVANSLFDEVKRIKGLVNGDDKRGMAALQASFAIDTAATRAGDQEAGKRLPQLSQAILELADRTAGSELELRRIRGQTLASLEATLAAIGTRQGITVPGFASGGLHSGGLRLVGENGPELEVTGPSRIFNAPQTAAMLSGSRSGDQEALLRELQALRAEVAQLRAEQRAGHVAIAQNTARSAKVLDRVSRGGDAFVTKEQAATP